MDIAKAREILDKNDKIDKPKPKNGLQKGLDILSKYDPDCEANTDDAYEIYAADFEATVAQMTEEEVEEMKKLGWLEHELYECWVFMK